MPSWHVTNVSTQTPAPRSRSPTRQGPHHAVLARWSTNLRFQRPAGSSGKEANLQLHSARQACLDDGIPADDPSPAEHTHPPSPSPDDLSPAEHMHHIYPLSLPPSQSAQFLASLSSSPQASDDHLLQTPPGAADRRAAAAGRTGPEPRTARFRLRAALRVVESVLSLTTATATGATAGGPERP